MQHSSFDLEIYARTYQENVLRDAKRAELIDQARNRSGSSGASLTSVLARLIASARSLISVRPPVPATPVTPSAATVPGVSWLAAPEATPARAVRVSRAAEPYAGMIVVARAANMPIAEQPCVVKDC